LGTDIIVWGWGLLTLAVIIGLICLAIMTVAVVKQRPEAVTNAINALLDSNRALQLVTICAIVMALLFLGLADKLKEGVLALLGTLGGYVLGNLGRQSSSPQRGGAQQSESSVGPSTR